MPNTKMALSAYTWVCFRTCSDTTSYPGSFHWRKKTFVTAGHVPSCQNYLERVSTGSSESCRLWCKENGYSRLFPLNPNGKEAARKLRRENTETFLTAKQRLESFQNGILVIVLLWKLLFWTRHTASYFWSKRIYYSNLVYFIYTTYKLRSLVLYLIFSFADLHLVDFYVFY